MLHMSHWTHCFTFHRLYFLSIKGRQSPLLGPWFFLPFTSQLFLCHYTLELQLDFLSFSFSLSSNPLAPFIFPSNSITVLLHISLFFKTVIIDFTFEGIADDLVPLVTAQPQVSCTATQACIKKNAHKLPDAREGSETGDSGFHRIRRHKTGRSRICWRRPSV